MFKNKKVFNLKTKRENNNTNVIKTDIFATGTGKMGANIQKLNR